MKAAVIEKPGTIVVREMPMPDVRDQEVLIRVVSSGICGTDIHIFRGEYIGTYPVIPGHEFSGVVEAVGKKVTRLSEGDRVAVEPNIACDNCAACLENRQNFCKNWNGIGVTLPGGMAEYVAVPEKAAFAIGDIPFNSGAFVEPLSCVLHGVERAEIRLGDRVLIIGAGPIGILLSKSIQLQGAAEITHVERNGDRRKLARTVGAREVHPSLEGLRGEEFEVVVDATGAPRLMEQALSLVRPGGKLLLFGVPPATSTLTLPAFPIFKNGLTVLSSYTSVRNSPQAVRLLESESIDVKPLVSHELSLAEFRRGIEIIESGSDGVLKVLIHPQKEPDGIGRN